MTSSNSNAEPAPVVEENFSLVDGGPFFKLLRRAHLSNDSLGLFRRRSVFFALLTWAPLLVLSALQGHLVGGDGSLPFLKDIECHLRFLVVVPLLVAAEPVVHGRMRLLVAQFRVRGLVRPEQMARFDKIEGDVLRLRNSAVAEALLIAFVYGVGILVFWRQYIAVRTGTWYSSPTPSGQQLSLAGIWFVFASLPIYQFLLCRWYFRLMLWAKFLWDVSGLDLDLKAIHPDRSGGLGFLGASLNAFLLIAAAHGVLFTGVMTNRIFYKGATFFGFKFEISLLVIFLLFLFAGPLTVFAPKLARLRRVGTSEFAGLAQTYVRTFDTKWIRGRAPAGEPLIGSGDIQSLADLGNSYAVVVQMQIVPVSRRSLVYFVAAILIPMAPLLLTAMPAEKLIGSLVGMVF